MIIRVQLRNAAGNPAEGLPVTLTGCGAEPAVTGPSGVVQFLTDDDTPTVTITIGGAPAWSGPSSELRENEVFVQSDSGFARQ